MALNQFKITERDLSTKGVVSAPDRLIGDPQANKLVFDRLIRDAVTGYLNGLIDALTATSGAYEVGASVASVTEQTVGGVLMVQDGRILNRYTKAEVDAIVGAETENLVATVDLNLDTGVLTITQKDGTVTSWDTALEKVPATFEIVTVDSVPMLRVTNVDGSTSETPVDSLVDEYTFESTSSIGMTTVTPRTTNRRTVSAVVRPASITNGMLSLEVTASLEQYRADAQEAQAVASQKAIEASASAVAAVTAETGAKTAETGAAESATEAGLAQQGAAQAQAQATAQAGLAEGFAVIATEKAETATSEADRAKREADRASDIVGGDFATKAEAQGFVDIHAGDTVVHITASERTNWDGKVSAEVGKGLSANDYTDAEKTKLAGLSAFDPAPLEGELAEHVADVVSHMTAAERGVWDGKAEGSHGHTASEVGATPASHGGDVVRHITAAEREHWNSKAGEGHGHLAVDVGLSTETAGKFPAGTVDVDGALGVLSKASVVKETPIILCNQPDGFTFTVTENGTDVVFMKIANSYNGVSGCLCVRYFVPQTRVIWQEEASFFEQQYTPLLPLDFQNKLIDTGRGKVFSLSEEDMLGGIPYFLRELNRSDPLNYYYWTTTQSETNPTWAWAVSGGGIVQEVGKDTPYHVRPSILLSTDYDVEPYQKLTTAKGDPLHITGMEHVVGSYTGDGKVSRLVELGFYPSALIVMNKLGEVKTTVSYNGGLATRYFPVMYENTQTKLNVLKIIASGFVVVYNANARIYANSIGQEYHYIAFR